MRRRGPASSTTARPASAPAAIWSPSCSSNAPASTPCTCPYQATTQRLAAAAGTLQFTFDTVGNARGVVEAGKVIPLAVSGARRATAAPDVPTLGELGYKGFDDLFVADSLLAPVAHVGAIGLIKALNREVRFASMRRARSATS